VLILIHPSCYAHTMCLHRLLHYGPYSTDESISINSYQNGVSNPTTLGGLDVDSATTKASLLKVFSDKCIGFFKGLGKKEAKKAFNYPMAAALLLLLLKVFVILSHSACSGSLKAKKKNCKVKNRVSKRLLYSFMRISALFISLGRVVVSDMTAADIEQVCTCCYHCTSCYHSHSFDCYNLTHLYSSTFRLEMMLL